MDEYRQPIGTTGYFEWIFSDWFGIRVPLWLIWWGTKKMNKSGRIPNPVLFAWITLKIVVSIIALLIFNWARRRLQACGLFVYYGWKIGFATRENFLLGCLAFALGMSLREADMPVMFWVASDAATTQLRLYTKRVSASTISVSSSTRKSTIERRESSYDGYSSDGDSGYAGSTSSSPKRLRRELSQSSSTDSFASFDRSGASSDLAASRYSGNDSDIYHRYQLSAGRMQSNGY